jgi:hypothetical protein
MTNSNARLSAHVSVDSSSNGCWLWTGALSSQGKYPGFTDSDGSFVYAHRMMFENTYGPIPEGWHVHHVCNNRRCIRPDHLEAISPEKHRAIHAAEFAKKRASRGAYFLTLKESGLSVRFIADLMGLTAVTIYAYLRQARLAQAQ